MSKEAEMLLIHFQLQFATSHSAPAASIRHNLENF